MAMVMHQTDDLVLWPVVRRAGQNFLRSVQHFYVYNQGDSALLFTRNRTCYAIGKNSNGSLGVGPDMDEVTQPTEVVELRGIKIVACHSGDGHVMVVTSEEDLWGWGRNCLGQVGCGNQENQQHRPVMVISGVHIVRCGELHTAALKPDGTLWCWGWNGAGQLGLGHQDQQTTPTEVTRLTGQRVVYIDCSSHCSVALTNHSRIYHWGWFNKHKFSTPTEVSLPSGLIIISSLTCGFDDFILLGEDGHVHHCYYKDHSKLHCGPIELEEPVQSVAGINSFPGSSYCFKLRSGEVTVWNMKRVIRTTLTSLVDACALYCDYLVTPHLTILPSHAINEPVLRSISQFNNMDTSDFTLQVEGKSIYLNKKVASKLSSYLAEQFEGLWNNQKMVKIEDFSFVMYFTYLGYIHTDSLSVIEPDWAFELLSLADKTKATELGVQCFQVIQSNENCSKMITNPNDKRIMMLNYLSKSLTSANCCFYYQLAVEAKDRQLQEQIVRFVAGSNWQSLCATEGYQQATSQHIKTLFAQAAELLRQTMANITI